MKHYTLEKRSKHNIKCTIPAWIVDRLGWKAGDRVAVDEDGGEVRIRKVNTPGV